MSTLIETRVQKFILLVGGVSIFIRLYDVSFYERYHAILQAIGIAILTFILLVVLRGYDPMQIWRFIKRYKKILLGILVIAFLVLGIKVYEIYKDNQKSLAYQSCLDKVAATTSWGEEKYTLELFGQKNAFTRNVSKNKYFDEWIGANRPYYNGRDHWEAAFMKWMMENHPDFCSEYDPNLIRHHIEEK